ncbi:MAG TPA: acyl-CoA dehydrogenase [Streptosporangiaceae bacterium]|nr:acyl-CoA dehydrogenase [Streptosporangiaceae bacterium]
MPIASTDEQLALQASIREWAKRARSIDLVRALEPGQGIESGDHGVEAAGRWASLAELGVLAVGLPAEVGGAGGAPELAAALAQLTESLVPGPILPTLLAAQALTRGQDGPAAREALGAIAAGAVSIAVALDPSQVTARVQPDGSVELAGRSGPVLGGGTTTHLLIGAVGRLGGPGRPGAAHRGIGDDDLGSVWVLLPADHPGIVLTPRVPADFSRSLADLALTAAVASPEQVLTGVSTEDVHDLAAALGAVEAAAVSSWCTRTAAEYATIRHQFGRPIGSFQAVKHLCAGMLCRSETAAALAWDAARAIDDTPGDVPLIAAAAAAFNLDAAVDAAKDCIQVLGGIGFTWEHDVHLYLRRALALRQLLGGAARWRDRTARLALAGARRQLALTAHADGESALDDELAAVRTAAREQAARVAPLPEAEQRRALADSGYAAPAWPPPHGLAASPAACLVIDDELVRAGLARPDIVIGGWAIPAILGHGTAAQADKLAGPTLRGEITWCQLFSEPEAGSDLASLRTRAERTDGGWRLTGQKVWTSLARQADWAICLARTDASVPKHKGLTYFLVPMTSPGIDVRPLREITGREMFNQVFLDQVFVPDDCVVGAPGDGWRVARTTLASERVAMGTDSSVGEAVERLLDLAARCAADTDPVVRQQLGALVAAGIAVSLLDLQAVITQLRGGDPGPLAAVRKLVGVSHRQAVAEAAFELTGLAGAAADGQVAGILEEFLLTRCLSIAGGTTQILLSVIAERLLGLPREEAR